MRIKEEVAGRWKGLVLLWLGIQEGQGAGQQPYEGGVHTYTGWLTREVQDGSVFVILGRKQRKIYNKMLIKFGLLSFSSFLLFIFSIFPLNYLFLLCVVRDGAVANSQHVNNAAVEPHHQAWTVLRQPAVHVLGVHTLLAVHLWWVSSTVLEILSKFIININWWKTIKLLKLK